MNAATINPSAVNAYLDRVRRFVDGVNKLQERLNLMLSGHLGDSMEQAETRQASPQPVQAADYRPETPAMPQANAPAPVTPDEVDLDAILNSINLDNTLNYA